jgi:cytochrome oxidase Cu insertion factor (SCO1/SenC/PrrC family)
LTFRFLVRYYAALAAVLVAAGGVLVWRTVGQGPPAGTLVVIASARTSQTLMAAPVRLHSSRGWQQLAGRPPEAVPVAPDQVVLAQASIPAGSYDGLEVGFMRLPLALTVAPSQVQPLLVEVAEGRINPNGLYVGGQEVSLGLNELAGRHLAVPPFRLLDQHGRVFDNSSIAGRDVLLAAFHTDCHTTCPLYTGLYLQLRRQVPASTLLVEVTTDPLHDTPEVLRAYAAGLDATWTFATGPPEAVADFWKTFKVELGGGDGHSSILLVIDRHGFLRKQYQGVPRLDQPLAAPLRVGLNGQGLEQLRSRGDGWGAAQVLDALRTVGSQLERSAIPGGPAPEFAAVDLAGRPVSLSRFRGRPLVINFWATWCAPCRRELPLLQRVASSHPGLAVLLVNEDRDDAARARSFAGEVGLSLPSAHDAEGRVAAAYKIGPALPATIFVSAMGTIESTHVGELDEATLANHLRAIESGPMSEVTLGGR